jgi:tripartite-type tricarboxylate transporter receptor subunit TctC
MRRTILKAGAAALAGFAGGLARPALAQGAPWPSRPIRLIVPYIPGSAPDVIARHLVDRVGATLGQPVVIENRGGAGGNIGNEVARARRRTATRSCSGPTRCWSCRSSTAARSATTR